MQSEQFLLHSQIEQSHWWFTARRRVMHDLVMRLMPPGRNTVVDVGCGTGANLAALAGDFRCLGIDASCEAIDLARRKHPDVQFVHGFAPDDLGEAYAQAGVVLLMDVLEHVKDDFALFSQLFAAAQPGTRFLITVPADLRLWSQHDESFGHYRRYDDNRLARVWQDLSAMVMVQTYFNARLYPLVRLIRGVNRWRGQASGSCGTDFRIPRGPVNRCLESVFAGESRAVTKMIDRRRRPYRRGVSLLAVVERLPGSSPLRSKPDDLAADHFDPAAASTAG